MAIEDKTKIKFSKEIIPEKKDPIEEGMIAFKELLIDAFRVEPSNPKLEKVMLGQRALIAKVNEIDQRGSYYSDEIFKIKQNNNK